MARQERVFHKELIQGTDEWFLGRMGKVTCSEFKTVNSKGRGSAPSKGRRTYMLKLMGERLTGQGMYTYTNTHMERGKEQEGEARSLYEMASGNSVDEMGFISMGYDIGCSPDGLVGDPGMVEIKTRLAHIQLELVLADMEGTAEVPSDNIAQCQGGLWVAEREWIDYVSYCPGLPIVIIRVERDEKYIADLTVGVNRFLAEMHELLRKF